MAVDDLKQWVLEEFERKSGIKGEIGRASCRERV